MHIVAMRTIMGPNYYSHRPVQIIDLNLGSMANRTSDRIDNLKDNLIALLPGLAEHTCSPGYPGGFIERLESGTYLGHVVEHVALEICRSIGVDVSYGTTRALNEKGLYRIVFSCSDARTAPEVAALAVTTVSRLCRGKKICLTHRLQVLREMAAEIQPGPSSAAILKAAADRNIPVVPLDSPLLYQLGYGCKARRVQAAETSLTSGIAADIATDKELTKALLADAGLPVPPGYCVSSALEAYRAAEQIGYPVVVKPADGCKGKGVSLLLENKAEVLAAYKVARQFSKRVLVEKHICGKDYRLVIVNGKVAAASERQPPCVYGDGQHTIAELIAEINADPRRGLDHEKPLTKINVDDKVADTLQKQNLSLDTVLRPGAKAFLRWHANLSIGGTAIDVTDIVHPSVAEACVRAARIIGLDIAGVDLIAEDISQHSGKNMTFIEINAAPGLRMHLFPAEGQQREVGQTIVSYLFGSDNNVDCGVDGGVAKGPKDNGRIPLVAVTGTNGKTTVTRLIASAFAAAGYHTGYCSTDGVFLGDTLLAEGDYAGPRGAAMILKDPATEAAVLEVARGGILSAGLGYDYAQVAVITNISEDHLGSDGIMNLEDLAHLKALVAERVLPNGCVVLNADDPLVAAMAKGSPALPAYFSLNRDNVLIRQNINDNLFCGYLDNEYLCINRGHENLLRLKTAHLPATNGGLILHNIQNLLAAAVAAIAAGIDPEAVKKSMLAFTSDAIHNPGRFNIFGNGRCNVIVDYGHNPAGVTAALEAADKMPHSSLWAVVAVPGDRCDATIRKVGTVAGTYCDHVIIKEDADRRGRKSGATANLILEGVMSARSRNGVEIILDEGQAVRHALTTCPDAALIIVFYENLQIVLNVLREFGFLENDDHESCAQAGTDRAISDQDLDSSGVTLLHDADQDLVNHAHPFPI